MLKLWLFVVCSIAWIPLTLGAFWLVQRRAESKRLIAENEMKIALWEQRRKKRVAELARIQAEYDPPEAA